MLWATTITNGHRAERAQAALETYATYDAASADANDVVTALSYLLGDLRHFAERVGVDLDAAFARSTRMAEMERDEDEPGTFRPAEWVWLEDDA